MRLDTVCDSLPALKRLVLRDKCFKVEYQDKVLADFCCFGNINYPLDGVNKLMTKVGAESDYVLFDNQYDVSPSPPYLSKDVVRGILLCATFPSCDNDGVDLEDGDKNFGLTLYDSNGNFLTIPVFGYFSWFGNPVTDNNNMLINKMEVVNSNNYDIDVSAFLVLVAREGLTLDPMVTTGTCG